MILVRFSRCPKFCRLCCGDKEKDESKCDSNWRSYPITASSLRIPLFMGNDVIRNEHLFSKNKSGHEAAQRVK